MPASLRKLLKLRVSCRRFSSEPLALAHLGGLLHAGYGLVGKAVVNGRKFDHRPVPSAGALYPMHIFVLIRAVAGADMGTYRFDPAANRLTPVGTRPADATIAAIFLDQPYVSTASAIIVTVAELGRPLERYADRGYRYVLFEAGHVAQNVALCAAATGVGNLQIGGFLDDHLTTVLRIDGRTTVPLYAAAVGYPQSEDPAVVRCTE